MSTVISFPHLLQKGISDLSPKLSSSLSLYILFDQIPQVLPKSWAKYRRVSCKKDNTITETTLKNTAKKAILAMTAEVVVRKVM